MEYTVDIEIRNENEEPIPYFIFDSDDEDLFPKSEEYEKSLDFFWKCHSFFESCSTGEHIECRVEYDEESGWIYLRNNNGVLSLCSVSFDELFYVGESEKYDYVCQFLKRYDVDRAEIISAEDVEKMCVNEVDEPVEEYHYKLTISFIEDEVSEAIKKDREGYEKYLYEQEMNEESAYYALGGSDYDRFKENGGEIDDMLDLAGY